MTKGYQPSRAEWGYVGRGLCPADAARAACVRRRFCNSNPIGGSGGFCNSNPIRCDGFGGGLQFEPNCEVRSGLQFEPNPLRRVRRRFTIRTQSGGPVGFAIRTQSVATGSAAVYNSNPIAGVPGRAAGSRVFGCGFANRSQTGARWVDIRLSRNRGPSRGGAVKSAQTE